MADTRRCSVAGKFTHARDPRHANARALSHVLTEYPPQVRGDERGEARARDQHAVQQQFQHPQPHQLPHFLTTMLLVVSVTISGNNSNGITKVNSASASSHQRSCGSQQTCLCSYAQAAHEQPVSAAQHADECWHGAARSTRVKNSFALSSSSARSPARPHLSLSAADA